MRLPQAQKEVIGINSIQEKAETTLVNFITGPEGYKFIGCSLHVSRVHSSKWTVYLGIMLTPT